MKKQDAKAAPLTPQQRLLLLDTWQRSGLPAGDFAAMVGLLVPSLANQFFGALACAVETAAARYGCNVMTFSTFRNPERERVGPPELACP